MLNRNVNRIQHTQKKCKNINQNWKQREHYTDKHEIILKMLRKKKEERKIFFFVDGNYIIGLVCATLLTVAWDGIQLENAIESVHNRRANCIFSNGNDVHGSRYMRIFIFPIRIGYKIGSWASGWLIVWIKENICKKSSPKRMKIKLKKHSRCHVWCSMFMVAWYNMRKADTHEQQQQQKRQRTPNGKKKHEKFRNEIFVIFGFYVFLSLSHSNQSLPSFTYSLCLVQNLSRFFFFFFFSSFAFGFIFCFVLKSFAILHVFFMCSFL